MASTLRLSVLLLLYLGKTTSARPSLQHSHPCAPLAASHKTSFASTCASLFARTHSHVYACLTVSQNVSLPSDPLALAHSPDSLVGRIRPTAAAEAAAELEDASFSLDAERESLVHALWADDVFPLLFDPEQHAARVAGFGDVQFVCYSARVPLELPAGTYSYFVLLEYRNWEWDPAWSKACLLNGTCASNFGSLAAELHPEFVYLPDPSGTAQLRVGSHEASSHPLPPCGETPEQSGTWRDGVFVPHSCTISDISYTQFDTCMAKLDTVLWLGDSNSRRASTAAPYCACEDCETECESGWWKEDGQPWGDNWQAYASAGVSFPNGSVLYVERSTDFPFDQGWLPYMLELRKPKVLVFAGAGAWPESGSSLSEFAAAVSALAQELKTLLPAETRLIFRTGPHYCCSNASSHSHRFTGGRQAVMSKLYKTLLRRAFPEALWWDTRALGLSQPIAAARRQATECTVNHLPGWQVAEDVKMLMHLLCLIADG
jgi:hypothetical protein